MKPYEDYCNVCECVMDRVTSDGTMVVCTQCWVPKPIPHAKLPTHVKLAEVKRIKSFQTKRS